MYITWYCYRLPDHGGFVRLFAPSGTPRLHSKGSWAPDGVSITALHPQRRYVVHWWRGDGRSGYYVDAVRSIEISSSLVSYVDLYLDLAFEGREWLLLDEEELHAASPDDARLAREAIAEARAQIEAGGSLFDPHDDIWAVPTDAMGLMPRPVERLD
ncbi:MAG: DUF402 domain-containing protein [Actinobacteria bacterium]|nr:DUF402 domain-containing protein [Actinomycetota bacterium]